MPKTPTQRKNRRKALLAAAKAVLPLPDKDALVVGMVADRVEKNLARIAEEIENTRGLSLEERVDRVVRVALSQFLAHRTTLRLLLDHVPLMAGNPRLMETIRHELKAHRAELGPRNLEAAAFVMVHAMAGIFQGVIFQYPTGVTEKELASQVVRLVRTYLVRPGAESPG